VSRSLQHRLHTQLRTAVAVLDLPLGDLDLERLAVEMTAPVKAILAEAREDADEEAPLAVAVTVPVLGADVSVELAAVVAQQGALPVPVGPTRRAPMSTHVASARLAQYGERTSTWSTATYDSGTEKALHEIALAFQARVAELEAGLPVMQEALIRALDRVAELEAERHSTNEALDDAVQALRADRPAATSVPRTERSRWVTIADALNAAHAAGMPVGIDLDGTLTDHRAWSVVWDRTTEQWTVAGYEAGFANEPAGHPW
jgi:hypothetical protein